LRCDELGPYSPRPLRLRDGRTVALLGRREYRPSIAVVWSEDNGKTWSYEAIIREDATGSGSATRLRRSSTTAASSQPTTANWQTPTRSAERVSSAASFFDLR
jgi:hypothetical protein